MDQLKEMLERARKTTMTSEERELQRQSFAYGNTKFENERITRATVDRASKALARDSANKA
jgi:primase-polymerase (primpol)-like protein